MVVEKEPMKMFCYVLTTIASKCVILTGLSGLNLPMAVEAVCFYSPTQVTYVSRFGRKLEMYLIMILGKLRMPSTVFGAH